ncbi:hypothetical protein Ccrd_001967 [Cynara cardunculus var. scolymus]|uniref:Uncharacterized protein n=1 Tax=Cynara cardunculus var. scolymus TaxID=59895 RepID=A0A124SD62_CYNCS|nr:hypothetical protein Ccrd_001967 [Cynara cardunculus var. scolymus]
MDIKREEYIMVILYSNTVQMESTTTLVSHTASRLLPQTSRYESHEQWMAHYGRVYTDDDEKEQRSKKEKAHAKKAESVVTTREIRDWHDKMHKIKK